MRPLVAVISLLLGAFATSTALAAGDVTVVAKKGELQLVGDDLADDVQIDRDPETKEIVVLGRNGTTINGGASYRAPAQAVRSIRATMNGGDDVLALGGLRLKRLLSADLGAGNDTLSLDHVVVAARVTVHGGDGDDAITVASGSDLRRGGVVSAEEGANHVAITDSYVRGPMRILTGGGDDLVEIHRDGFTEGASLSVRTGLGDDVVDYLGNTLQCPVETLTGGGGDTIHVKTSRFVKAVGMNGGDGDDDVNIERCTFVARFFISGGKGTNRAAVVGTVTSSGGLVFAGGTGRSGNFYWSLIIVHVF
jgi:hypothetical protein